MCENHLAFTSPNDNDLVYLQLIDEDVRDPYVGGRHGHLFDLIKVLWVPHQELISPFLTCLQESTKEGEAVEIQHYTSQCNVWHMNKAKLRS